MQVSVETLSGLERKLMVSVPTEEIEAEVSSRLKKLAPKVKIDGFRPGKVPFKAVVERYSDSVRYEVVNDMLDSSLRKALKEHELVPAGTPFVEPEPIEKGKDFKYSATIEVFPEIQVSELGQADIEQVQVTVADADVKKMLDKLREQHKDWVEVTRDVAMGDKLILDFKGFLNGKAFEGGTAEDYELVLGSGSMIPGFEEQLVGAKKDKPFDINVKFPEEYGHKDLAGKETTFNITVKQVFEGKPAELNDAFAEKFNIKEGGVEALTKDIQQNMERELERRISTMNREKAFDGLLAKNTFDIPKGLIDQEIENLKHEMYHRIFGHEHSDNEKIPDFPRELFEEQARRRVHLGLLFSEYVKKHEMTVDKARVDAMIEKLASAYESPEELRAWYRSKKERLAEIEALVMEEMVAEHILKDAKIVKKKMTYDDVMNPQKENKEQDAKGE